MEIGYSREFKAGQTHPEILRACEAVSRERLEETVSAISYPRHIVRESSANLRAGNWILEHFEEIGLRSQPQGNCRNIIGKCQNAHLPRVISAIWMLPRHSTLGNCV